MPPTDTTHTKPHTYITHHTQYTKPHHNITNTGPQTPCTVISVCLDRVREEEREKEKEGARERERERERERILETSGFMEHTLKNQCPRWKHCI
jgi:hypothetical protein